MNQFTCSKAPSGAATDSLTPDLDAFYAYLQALGFSKNTLLSMMSSARHFQAWLEHTGTPISTVDDIALRQFRDHDCQCPAFRRGRRTRKYAMSGAWKLTGFMESSGAVSHPDECLLVSGFLNAFSRCLAERGVASNTQHRYLTTCEHFTFWLFRRRIPIAMIDAHTVESFFTHDCVCGDSRKKVNNSRARTALKRFIELLVDQGAVSSPSLVRPPEPAPQEPEFANWLRRHRGIKDSTIRQHVRHVTLMANELKNDDGIFCAKHIRQALLHRFESASTALAWAWAGSVRMYLRYLSSRGECSAALVHAVPTVKRWKLQSLPKYLSGDEVERVIAACDPANAAGLRDRAMFLLMARLGLRPGDVMMLKITDIDWRNAQVCVSGKSQISTQLPLPQDAGDAVAEYIEKSRPRIACERVFLTAAPPYGPITNVCTISNAAAKAIKRAGFGDRRPRGAYVFRHSVATSLIRSGATLNQIQVLLRHRSCETTAIYAKVDRPMLKAVAQPWIGGVR